MLLLTALLVFVFGTIVGSFLNVVIYRYNTGQTVAGRSACMSCAHTLAWYELLPIVSFFALGGRCRSCHSKISWQYPMVEALTGLVFMLLLFRFSFLDYFQLSILNFELFFPWFFFSVLIVISVYDLRHMIIPDGLVYASIILGFLHRMIFPITALDWWSGLVIFLAFALTWYFSGGKWMGFGDAKLALALGWFLPYPFNISAIILAFWLGAAIGIIILLRTRIASRRRGKGRGRLLATEIPFAPFLVLATFIVFLTNLNLIPLL